MMQRVFDWRLDGRNDRVWGVSILLALVVAAFLAVALWTLVEARRDAWNHARTALEDLTFSIDHAVSRDLEQLDISLRSVVAGLQAARSGGLSAEQQRTLLSDPAPDADYIDEVRILDRAGLLVSGRHPASSPGESAANLDYFEAHRNSDQAGLFIGRPILDPLNGQWHMALSRGLRTADGAFDGVVVAMLTPNHFADLVRRFEFGPGDVTATIHQDASVAAPALMSPPPATSPTGVGRLGSGEFESFVSVSPLDGRTRLNAFSRIARSPIYVTTSVPVETLLARWRRRAWVMGGVVALLVCFAGGAAVLLIGELRRRQQATRAAQQSEARYSMLAENSGDMVVLLDLAGINRYVSTSVAHVLGSDAADLLGKHFTAHVEAEDHACVQAALAEAQAGAAAITVRYRCARKDGRVAWLEARMRGVRDPLTGAIAEVVSSLRDVTARKMAEEKMNDASAALAQLAATDGLTGLANRRHFDEALEREWRRALREQQPISLLMLDADAFKSYNDCYGHQMGDEVLRDIADCIRNQSRRPGDTPARYGGEEFAVILSATDELGAIQVAENICRSVAAARMPHSGNEIGVVTVSIGVASIGAVRGSDCGDLLAAADAALYEAKRRGRNRVFCAATPHETVRIPALSD